jgi:hypothetical protein
MFPELTEMFKVLPVMIGDSELINAHYLHLAGFNRVQERIPGTKYWARKGEGKISDTMLQDYLSFPHLFENGIVNPEFELMLAFHGLFAISHPGTWEKSREVQLENMISLCELPMNYRKVDEFLDMLSEYIQKKNLNARVAQRKVITERKDLVSYVDNTFKEGLEGAVVVQHAVHTDGTVLFDFAKSIKIKNYETIDAAILGVYLHKGKELVPQNMKGLLLGLYDEEHDCYLPVCKVNLNPDGVQVKTDDQKERLVSLNAQLTDVLKDKSESDSILKLYDVYLKEAQVKLSRIVQADYNTLTEMLGTLPRGHDFGSLFEMYEKDIDRYANRTGKKKLPSADEWIYSNVKILESISGLKDTDKKRYREIMKYFSKASEIKTVSKKLETPQIVLDTTQAVIVETRVFDIKYNLNPFPAGFHSWYMNSFMFNNCYPERIRYDKSSTTDYSTVYEIAGNNTVRKNTVSPRAK